MGPITRVTAPTVDVLDALLAAQEPMWGLAIAKQTGRTPASIYPILSRLEAGGWLQGSWEDDAERPGPRRRLYQLTNAGRAGGQQIVDDFQRRRPASVAPVRPLLA